MRVVADTNTVVSGLFWLGPPRTVLDAARLGVIRLFTSPKLLAELEDVLSREKFSLRVARVGSTPSTLVVGYAALATVVSPPTVSPIVSIDPDDDEVIACALTARANAIVSGDSHLLRIGQIEDVIILSAPGFVTTHLSP